MTQSETAANSTLRESIVSRIRKLSKFTTQAGCTEFEAQAALAKVRELISQHNVTQDELAVRFEASRCITDEFIELNATFSDWTSCAVDVAKLYHTRVWSSRAHEDPLGLGMTMPVTKVRFFGLSADVAASIATCSIIYTAVNTEAAKFKGHRISFRLGMIARLSERLREMAKEPAPRATGTALLVLKDQLVTEEYAKLNLCLRASYGPRASAKNSAAFAAGRAAGSSVDLGGGKVTAQRAIAGRN